MRREINGQNWGVYANVQFFVAGGPFARFAAMPMTGRGRASERVFLITLPDYPAGTVLRYCLQAMANVSDRPIGRYPDGTGPMQILLAPPPLLPNVGLGASTLDSQANQP